MNGHKLRCYGCGILLDHNDTERRPSYLCEYGGASFYEDIEICPVCGSSELEEVEACRVCGEYHIPAPRGYDDVQMYEGICEKCLCEASVETCVKIARCEGSHLVEINAFLATAFTSEEIEDILIEALKRSPRKAVTDYALGDPEWFAEKYAKLKGLSI